MKLLWLAPYPLKKLEDIIELARPIGAEHSCSWIVNLLPELRKMLDEEIHIITTSTRIKYDQVVHKDGITFHVLKSGIPFLHRGFPAWFGVDALMGFYFLRRKIVQKINKICPDVIHAFGTESVYGLSATDIKEIPCIISMQGIICEINKVCPSIWLGIRSLWEKKTIKAAKFFDCRTHYDKRFVLTVNPRAKVYTIHRVINPIFFQENKRYDLKCKNILFVGSLFPWKGVDVLLKALPEVKKVIPEVKLFIVGAGPLDEELRKLSVELEVDGNVEFIGAVSSEKIIEYQKTSQIFVLPSRNDNSPNSLVEAMAAGLPVVATNVGGVSSMFDHDKSGILVSSEDSNEISCAIIRLLNDSNEQARLGTSAHNLIKYRNDPLKIASECILAYSDMMKSI